ncbi:MAG: amino acid permease [Deltaproteobacteria bacterium]|nr:amino acid permease [Deltaproteobacteria bacterium]MBW2497106.1 amino acid permease [Deltaproteobacteria bacterium]
MSEAPARAAPETIGAHPRDRLPRVLTLWDASMLIVASVIGAGIFFTPARVATLLPDASWILLAWLVGALLSLMGALANAELGAMFARAGGNYVYLREGLHPAAGFLTGWISFFAIYAGTIAALAVVLGDSLAGALGWGPKAGVPLAAAVIFACSALNARAVRWGAQANNLTSLAKLLALAAFVILGPMLGEGSFAGWLAESGGSGAGGAEGREGSLALRFGRALSPVLFSYLGWNASVYVASEIRDPGRNVPRSLFLGLGLCALLYLLVNLVFLYALAPAELRAASDTGEAAARALFGPVGGRWVGAFVLVSVLGTLNATVLVGPRIVYAMALDGHFFRGVDRVHIGYRTPIVAIWVQGAVAVGLVLFLRTFPKALDFTVFAIVLSTSADILALFALRYRRPELVRPYRAWGYPFVPALYLIVNLAVGVALVVGSPRETLTTGGLLAAGLLLYFPFARWAARRPPMAPD